MPPPELSELAQKFRATTGEIAGGLLEHNTEQIRLMTNIVEKSRLVGDPEMLEAKEDILAALLTMRGALKRAYRIAAGKKYVA